MRFASNLAFGILALAVCGFCFVGGLCSGQVASPSKFARRPVKRKDDPSAYTFLMWFWGILTVLMLYAVLRIVALGPY